jgi:hypothetical protein
MLKKLDLSNREGKPEANIIAELEDVLETLNVSRAAYHGGDFNKVACR